MVWDIDQTIGKLHRLWWWCLDFAPDGNVRRHSADMVAIAVGLSADAGEKFISALYEAEFLDKTSKNQLLIHDWLEYAGRYLRDTKFRRNPEKIKEIISLYSTIVRRQSADNPPKVGRKSAVPDLPDLPNPTFSLFWGLYPKKKARAEALKAWCKINPQDGLLEQILTAVRLQSNSADWKKEKGKYIPLPASWLNGKRWEDEMDIKPKGDPGLSNPVGMRDPGI